MKTFTAPIELRAGARLFIGLSLITSALYDLVTLEIHDWVDVLYVPWLLIFVAVGGSLTVKGLATTHAYLTDVRIHIEDTYDERHYK